MTETKKQTSYKPQVAYKVNIIDINKGDYVTHKDEPNYLSINGKKIFKVNVIGTIVTKSENSIMIDDGSASIVIQNFDESNNYNILNQGDIVNIIGKVWEYNSEKYIREADIVKKIDVRWLILRKKELDILKKMNLGEDATPAPLKKANESKENKKFDEAEEELVEDFKNNSADEDLIEIEEKIDNTPKTTTQKIFEVIKKIDAGDGADIEEIIRQVGDCESTIALMIKKGDIFENRAGRVKIL